MAPMTNPDEELEQIPVRLRLLLIWVGIGAVLGAMWREIVRALLALF